MTLKIRQGNGATIVVGEAWNTRYSRKNGSGRTAHTDMAAYQTLFANSDGEGAQLLW